MKKASLLLLILIALLIVGCGVGGLVEVPQSEGYIAFYLKKADFEAMSVGEPTNIRVRITHSNGFLIAKDIPVTSESEVVEIKVPAVDGYRIDAVSYEEKAVGEYNRLLKYDTAQNIVVRPGETTMVELVLKPFEIDLTLPEEVISGEKFQIGLSNVPDVLRNFARVVLKAEPFSTSITDHSGTSVKLSRGDLFHSGSAEFNAPESDVEGHMYLQAYIYLDSTFMTGADDYIVTYRYWLPDISAGEPQISVPLKLPEGGIGIGIVY